MMKTMSYKLGRAVLCGAIAFFTLAGTGATSYAQTYALFEPLPNEHLGICYQQTYTQPLQMQQAQPDVLYVAMACPVAPVVAQEPIYISEDEYLELEA